MLSSSPQNQNYERLKSQSDIPSEYFTYRLSNYNISDSSGKLDEKKCEALKVIVSYCDNIKSNFEKGRGIYIYGPPKSQLGITLLGTFVLRKALNIHKKCKFVEFPTFLMNLTSYLDERKVFQSDEYYNTDYLMIDSINAFQYLNNTRVKTSFADLVFHRRKNNKPIIFSSHSDPDLLSIAYCDTLSNYIESYCDIIDLSTKSVNAMTLIEARNRIDNWARNDPGREFQKYTLKEIENIIKNSNAI